MFLIDRHSFAVFGSSDWWIYFSFGSACAFHILSWLCLRCLPNEMQSPNHYRRNVYLFHWHQPSMPLIMSTLITWSSDWIWSNSYSYQRSTVEGMSDPPGPKRGMAWSSESSFPAPKPCSITPSLWLMGPRNHSNPTISGGYIISYQIAKALKSEAAKCLQIFSAQVSLFFLPPLVDQLPATERTSHILMGLDCSSPSFDSIQAVSHWWWVATEWSLSLQ